jgi:hypothetical protein
MSDDSRFGVYLTDGGNGSWCALCSCGYYSGQCSLEVPECESPAHDKHLQELECGQTDETTRQNISSYLDSRIMELKRPEDQTELKLLVYDFLFSDEDSHIPFLAIRERLRLLDTEECLVAMMMGAWKCLAISAAGDKAIAGINWKDVRAALEACTEHLTKWKLYQETVWETGQVHLIGILVGEFMDQRRVASAVDTGRACKRPKTS